MSPDSLSRALINLFDAGIPCVCAIKGAWGVGKTYYVKDLLRKYYEDKGYAYISVFGKSSLDEIKAGIFLKLSKIKRLKNIFEKFLQNISLNIAGFSINLGSVGSFLPIVDTDSIKDSII